MSGRARAIALLPLLAGCTFQPGGAFARLDEATLRAALEPGAARDLGDGGFLTELLYEVRLDAARLTVEEVELLELSGGGAVDFDPANPPPGYTLCHGGHCHTEDGRLVDYADVEAELAGGAASWAPVVAFPVGRELDLLAGERLELQPEGGRDLGMAEITKAQARATRLVLTGTVSGGPDGGGEEIRLAVDLAFDGQIGSGVEIPIDREEEPVLHVDIGIVPDGTVLDGIDFAARAEGGEVRLEDLSDPDAERLISALLAAGLEVTVERFLE